MKFGELRCSLLDKYMIYINIVFVVLLSLPNLTVAESRKDKRESQAKAADDAASNSTQHSFEDVLVQGKLHFSDEAVSTVEEDKVLDSLIGVRTQFNDRIEQSAGMY